MDLHAFSNEMITRHLSRFWKPVSLEHEQRAAWCEMSSAQAGLKISNQLGNEGWGGFGRRGVTMQFVKFCIDVLPSAWIQSILQDSWTSGFCGWKERPVPYAEIVSSGGPAAHLVIIYGDLLGAGHFYIGDLREFLSAFEIGILIFSLKMGKWGLPLYWSLHIWDWNLACGRALFGNGRTEIGKQVCWLFCPFSTKVLILHRLN